MNRNVYDYNMKDYDVWFMRIQMLWNEDFIALYKVNDTEVSFYVYCHNDTLYLS